MTNSSRPNSKPHKSLKMLRRKGKNYQSFSLKPTLSSIFLLFRQRKLKEARQAAEEEVAKYRKEKEAEFEKLKAEVIFITFRKQTRSSKLILRERPMMKLSKSSRIMEGTKTKLSICWCRRS